MRQFDLLVIGAANKPYEHFALPYAVSSLLTNPNSAVEILVEPGFEERYPKATQQAKALFRDRLVIAHGDFRGHPSCARFLYNPVLSAPYAYIGDIDVLMLVPVLEPHIEIAAEYGLPYSNIVREPAWERGEKRLTGCHFTEFDAYYPVRPPQGFDLNDMKHGVDERLLYAIVNERLGEPPRGGTKRPLQGFHVSPNGTPLQGWGVHHADWRHAYKKLHGNPVWRGCAKNFDPRYRALLALLDASIQVFEVFSAEEQKGYRALSTLMARRT